MQWLPGATVVLAVYAVTANADWLNDYDHPFSFTCPAGQFLSHISSQHHNGFEDRKWQMACRNVPVDGTLSNCQWTNFVNDFDQIFTYQCENEGIITGMESEHSNHYEDRRFKFRCCDVPGTLVHGCYYTQYQNEMDKVLDYIVPNGKILRGVSSHHSGHYEDRQFKFEICDIDPAHA